MSTKRTNLDEIKSRTLYTPKDKGKHKEDESK